MHSPHQVTRGHARNMVSSHRPEDPPLGPCWVAPKLLLGTSRLAEASACPQSVAFSREHRVATGPDDSPRTRRKRPPASLHRGSLWHLAKHIVPTSDCSMQVGPGRNHWRTGWCGAAASVHLTQSPSHRRVSNVSYTHALKKSSSSSVSLSRQCRPSDRSHQHGLVHPGEVGAGS